MTRILIVSDIRLYREGLALFLEGKDGAEVAGLCDSAALAVRDVGRLAPDVVLIDIGMAGAMETIQAVRSLDAGIKVLALGLSEDQEEIVACAEAGIAGYVCRDASVEELMKTIDSAVREELRCSRKVARALLQRVSSLASQGRGRKAAQRLTPRERQIVSLMDRGLTNKEISRRLTIEVSTVKNHVHNILEKLGVHTRGEAVARVREVHLGTLGLGGRVGDSL